MATFCDAKQDVVAAGHGFNSYFPASQRVRQRAEQHLQRSEELRTDQLGGWSVGDRSSWESWLFSSDSLWWQDWHLS